MIFILVNKLKLSLKLKMYMQTQICNNPVLIGVYESIDLTDEKFNAAFDAYFKELNQLSSTPDDAYLDHPLLHELFHQVARSQTDSSPKRSHFENKVMYVLSHVYYANLYRSNTYRDKYGYTPEQRLEKCKEHLKDFDDMFKRITQRVEMLCTK